MIKKSKVKYFKSDNKDFKSSLKKHLYKRKKIIILLKAGFPKFYQILKRQEICL